jgi:hypothetical protein
MKDEIGEIQNKTKNEFGDNQIHIEQHKSENIKKQIAKTN